MDFVADKRFLEEDSASRLCVPCQALFTAGSLEHGANKSAFHVACVPHHDGYASFESAVLQGCYICAIVKTDLGSRHPQSSQAKIFSEYGYIYLHIISVFSDPDGHSGRKDNTSYFMISDVDTHASLYRLSHASLQHDQTASIDSTRLVRGWLSTCLSEQHQQCGLKSNALPQTFPRRLLDVSCGLLRMIETAEQHFEPAHYATLSYCWGRKSFLNLTASNLQDFKKSIPFENMAKCFQDVITLVRQLDIRYLWIDSFCIIQSGPGSELDWQTEGVEMSRIYSNALLNIGSAHGHDAHAACYMQRQQPLTPPLCISWRPNLSDAPRLHHVHRSYGISRYLKMYNESKLLTRGWVFQERLLCPRMLYFTTDQFYWECSGSGQMLACEEFPAGMRTPRLKIDLFPWSLQRTNSRLANGKQEYLELWSAVVHHYTSLELTYPDKDKLLAVSGIARRLSEIMNDQYLAGMFRKYFIAQLSWVASRGSRRSASWRAPSWSFASMDGGVEIPLFAHYDLATVLHVNLQYAHSENPFGALRSGSLQLRCRPLPCDIAPKQSHDPLLIVADKPIEWRPDDKGSSLPESSELRIVFTSVCGTDHTDVRREPRLTCDEVMSIAKNPRAPEFRTARITIDGVVLRTIDEGTYVRVGALDGTTFFDHLALWYRLKEKTITVQ